MNEHRTTDQLEITVNGDKLWLESGTSVCDLLDQLDLNQRGIAVELNDCILPRETHSQQLVQDGDWFEIVTLVGGG